MPSEKLRVNEPPTLAGDALIGRPDKCHLWAWQHMGARSDRFRNKNFYHFTASYRTPDRDHLSCPALSPD